ncbi:hypothetical protein LTR78_006660 [Recurvomyces mirabilis]|uniref:Uncharacterized protein n=1 Tax=Recurvomyces mirabilis TaxID=574656 RepID=A0AAE0WKK2_9PEZI|nr:hypothetical protein LTR78_006660 [Recurvomyces mirabilis]KAK5151451.1 hypothetical protein LTS14_009294 [Recurvomyces mirabilis]
MSAARRCGLSYKHVQDDANIAQGDDQEDPQRTVDLEADNRRLRAEVEKYRMATETKAAKNLRGAEIFAKGYAESKIEAAKDLRAAKALAEKYAASAIEVAKYKMAMEVTAKKCAASMTELARERKEFEMALQEVQKRTSQGTVISILLTRSKQAQEQEIVRETGAGDEEGREEDEEKEEEGEASAKARCNQPRADVPCDARDERSTEPDGQGDSSRGRGGYTGHLRGCGRGRGRESHAKGRGGYTGHLRARGRGPRQGQSGRGGPYGGTGRQDDPADHATQTNTSTPNGAGEAQTPNGRQHSSTSYNEDGDIKQEPPEDEK